MTPMPTAPVRRGQIYESCVPTFIVDGKNAHTRIRVTGPAALRVGCPTVNVVTVLDDGREIRPRRLEVSQLHTTGTTKHGKPRRTGYRLVQDVETPDA